MEYLIFLVSLVVEMILAEVNKKYLHLLDNKLLPIQNVIVGVIICLIEWVITKDFKIALGFSGLCAGGTYDIIHNLKKLRDKEEGVG